MLFKHFSQCFSNLLSKANLIFYIIIEKNIYYKYKNQILNNKENQTVSLVSSQLLYAYIGEQSSDRGNKFEISTVAKRETRDEEK